MGQLWDLLQANDCHREEECVYISAYDTEGVLVFFPANFEFHK